MSNYLDDNIDQIVFLDVDYLQVLGEKTFESCLFELVTHKLDLSAFHGLYKNQKVDRKAYPLAPLLRIIFMPIIRASHPVKEFPNLAQQI